MRNNPNDHEGYDPSMGDGATGGKMKVEIEIDEAQIVALVKQRLAELFSSDARYRDTGVRDRVRLIVDGAAVAAVDKARAAIEGRLPAFAAEAVERQVKADIENATRRGLGALKKLYAGFDPARMTPEQLAWLKDQIAKAAAAKEGQAAAGEGK